MSYLGTTKIGKMFLGDTEIAKAYLGSNLVYQSGGGPSPQPTTIPYIRGGADGSYIDTGITPDNTTRVIVWARNFNPATNYTWLFGSREYGMTEQFGVYACITARTGLIGGLYASEFFYTGDAFSLMSGYHKYELNGNVFSVDDTVVATATAATITSSKTIYLFGMNSNSTLMSPVSPIDIFACQIYKNGVLVRDFTAVDSPSVGLYDSVSGTLFTNDGSGSFTYGEFNLNAYTPLEYIECAGAQYFDTGIYGGYAVPAIVKFRYYTSQNNVTLLGANDNSNWYEFHVNKGDPTQMLYRLASDSAYRAMYNAASSGFVSKDIVLVKGVTNSASLYLNNSQLGNTVSPTSSTSFVSSLTIEVGGNHRPTYISQPFNGRFYYVGFGSQRNYVPAKKGSKVGMYDTYNDVFKESATSTPFVAGPEL